MVKIKSFKKKLSEINKKRVKKINKDPKVLQKLDRIFNNANKIESKKEEEMYKEMREMDENFSDVFKLIKKTKCEKIYYFPEEYPISKPFQNLFKFYESYIYGIVNILEFNEE